MTTVICTDAERDLILAGARHLVVPGDRREGSLHPMGAYSRSVAAAARNEVTFVAPQRWVDATGPCPRCGGASDTYKVVGDRCPDCIDGRKRVALAVQCPAPFTHRRCHTCGDTGSVVFAHATVEVLPVCWHDDPFPGDPCIVVYRDRGDQYVVLYRNDTIEQIWLDPLPVPGRDWVVVLDDVELAP